MSFDRAFVREFNDRFSFYITLYKLETTQSTWETFVKISDYEIKATFFEYRVYFSVTQAYILVLEN